MMLFANSRYVLGLLANVATVYAASGVSTFNDVRLVNHDSPRDINIDITICSTRLKAGLLAQVNAFCVALIEHLTVAPKILGFSPSNSQGNNIFAAAMSDLSPLWVGARCEGTMNASNWSAACNNGMDVCEVLNVS